MDAALLLALGLLAQIKSDKQQLGSVIYSIQGPGVDEEPRGVFSIDKFTGKVSLNAMLDREKTDRFRLRAFALDLGGSTLEEPTDLEIVVVDQNDNRPVFRQEVFTGRVLEGAVPGTYVTRAEATDADDPETDNAALRYSILEQGGPQLFSIDPLTGEIRTVQVGLDREVVAVYNLTLQVADMSGDGLTATALAIITLEDINDNAPEFTGDQFFMEAAEAVSGVDVGRLEVEDRDLPGSPNWAARFTILEGDPDGQFTIRTDPRTNEGVLSVVKPLDYESRERYDLKVAVQNEAPLQAAAPKAERGQARVSVQVRDVNEAPVFQENPLRTSLAEGAAPGTPVATFSAWDPDTQQPQRLSYSKDYDPEDWLQVDGATGRVQTQRVLSPSSPFLKDGWYRAIILARDDASPPSTATGTLSIEILEVNDHAPELSPPWGSLCSTPDRGSGLLLGATDEDLPPHGAPFHFQLSPRVPELARNWSLSQVNVSHARLRPRLRVPEGLHRLSLLLQDSGQPPQQREQPLNVTVCRCGQDGACLPGAAALRAGGAGISLGALVIMLASVILLLCECPQALALGPQLLGSPTRPQAPPPGSPTHPPAPPSTLALHPDPTPTSAPTPTQCSPCWWPSWRGSGSSPGTRGFCTDCRTTSGTTSLTTTSRGAGRRTRTPTTWTSCATQQNWWPLAPPRDGRRCAETHHSAERAPRRPVRCPPAPQTSLTSSTTVWRPQTVTPASPPMTRLSSMIMRGTAPWRGH
ncbi:cadherin-15 isoform X3 [Ovis aries]|uniref:cadherin-15 isoform X3 n=1 Tax=Ovis aries TaxID=9940 RepID=UPI00295284DC|nr:cadherin-15 isoform X3 [Ovis aries]